MVVVAAFGTLANTTFAGLTAYFRATGCTALTIADVIPLFSKITAYEEEYVIGEMKIWDTGTESVEPNNCAMVRVMVYNDGWIVAWFDKEAQNQGGTSGCNFVDAQTLGNFGSFCEYEDKWNGCLLTVESSSPTDSECPDGTTFCIYNTDFVNSQIQVYKDRTANAYHFNLGHTYTINIYQSNGNLLWWGHNSSTSGSPTNLSNRLYRTIYEMWENLRYSSNTTKTTNTAITKAFLDDGGVFTDYTTKFNNTDANDVPLIPITEEMNDAFYFGHENKFNGLKLDIDTAGVGNTIVWEYWDGSTWTSLSVTDLTSGFTILTVHNHKVDDTSNPITSTNATDQTNLNTLLNEIKTDYNLHRVSTTYHDAADNINDITSNDASDLNTSIALANEIKIDYNAHRNEGGVHPYDDDGNDVTSANGTDLATTIVLANEIKGDYNEHLVATRDVNTVTFTPQKDWSKTFVNSSEQYWIRSRVSVAAYTTQPLLTQGWVMIPNSLTHINTNLGMYSFEDTSANYCLICGESPAISKTTTGIYYNTVLPTKIIYSHIFNYGFRSGGDVNSWGYYDINGYRIATCDLQTSHGFINLNIENIDYSIGIQNIFYRKSYEYYSNTGNYSMATVLITS